MTAGEIVYRYTDEHGLPLYDVVRKPPKEFTQRVILPNGRYEYRLNGVRRVPYRLPDLLAAKGERTIFVLEGEKDAESLRSRGLCATTNAGGAGWPWTSDFIQHFAGARRIVVVADCDQPGRTAAKKRAEALSIIAADVRLLDLDPKRADGYDVSDWLEAGHTKEELQKVVDKTTRLRPGDVAQDSPAAPASHIGTRLRQEPTRLRTTRADEVSITRSEWLAQDRIPYGGITFFDGLGGIGKTTFLTGIIAAVTRGIDFFTGLPIEPRVCLFVGIEDRRALIAQRLKIYHADLTMIHFVDAARVGERDVPLTLPEHLSALEQTINEHKIGLVYIDALFSHISLEGEGRMSQQARAALRPIVNLCERLEIAFVAMRHWGKSGGSALSRALGSVEFTNMARSVFSFGRHPNDDRLIACAHSKTNWGKLAGSVVFQIASRDVVDDNDQPWQVSIAENVGAASNVTADDLAMKGPSDPDERNAAAEWLRDYLADGQARLASLLLDAASKARVGSRATMYRAASSIGVKMASTATFPRQSTWKLDAVDEGSSRARTRTYLPGCETTDDDYERDGQQSPISTGFTDHQPDVSNGCETTGKRDSSETTETSEDTAQLSQISPVVSRERYRDNCETADTTDTEAVV